MTDTNFTPALESSMSMVTRAIIRASQPKPDPNSPASLRIAELRAKWEEIAKDVAPIPWNYAEKDERVFPTLLGFAVNFNASYSFPLDANGRLDSSRPHLITDTCAAMLYHGARVGSPLGERYFRSGAEARAFLVEPATEFEALAAILAIDEINLGVLPKASLQSATEAPEEEGSETKAETEETDIDKLIEEGKGGLGSRIMDAAAQEVLDVIPAKKDDRIVAKTESMEAPSLDAVGEIL